MRPTLRCEQLVHTLISLGKNLTHGAHSGELGTGVSQNVIPLSGQCPPFIRDWSAQCLPAPWTATALECPVSPSPIPLQWPVAASVGPVRTTPVASNGQCLNLITKSRNTRKNLRKNPENPGFFRVFVTSVFRPTRASRMSGDCPK